MFRAAIFDMDGTLVDSERCWRVAEREVFGSVGIDITEEMSALTAPLSPRQVTEHWFRHQPWPNPSFKLMETAVVRRVAEQLRLECAALPGAIDTVAACAARGWRIALASNSPGELCHLVIERLGLARHFDAVVSVDDVEFGKPDPAIYLLAAERLGVKPAECLAFEDSPTGARAARAAGMRVVAIPSAGQCFANAESHLLLGSLEEFTPHHVTQLWSA